MVPHDGVFVLGTPRSGTSAVTQCLSGLGLNAGDLSTHTPANRENPRGFYELKSMRRICDELLFSVDCDWNKLNDFSIEHVPPEVVRDSVERGRIVLEELQDPHWVVKEPRLGLLLPIIRRSATNPVAVHIYRNPMEVAKSLRTRNGISIQAGLALWEKYNLSILEHGYQLPCLRVRYEDLVADPTSTIESMRTWLLENGFPEAGQADDTQATKLLSSSLRHEVADEDIIFDVGTQSQIALWEYLQHGGSFPSSESEGLREALYDLEAAVNLTADNDRALREAQAEIVRRGAAWKEAAQRYREETQRRREETQRHEREMKTYTEALDSSAELVDGLLGMRGVAVRRNIQLQASSIFRISSKAANLLGRGIPLGLSWKQQAEIVRASSYFDSEWYRRQMKDSPATDADLARHYVSIGAPAGRDPGPNFSTLGYLWGNRDVEEAGLNPLVHYERFGREEGRSTGTSLTLVTIDRASVARHGPDAPRGAEAVEVPALFRGSFDRVEKHVISGWIQDRLRPGGLEIDLYVNGVLHAEAIPATEFRGDLASAGIGDGRHAFQVEVNLVAGENRLEVHPAGYSLPILTGTFSVQEPGSSTEFLPRASPDVVSEGRAKRRKFFDQRASDGWVAELRADSSAQELLQSQPLVSIVMPTKNRAEQIPDAIKSVLAQSYQNWQLHIIDDHSSDDTVSQIEAMFPDPRITISTNDGNGVCDARNRGLADADGDFIAYLDSDNIWTPGYLELMLCEFGRSKRDCAYSAEVIKSINPAAEDADWIAVYRQEEFDYESLKRANFIDLNVFMHRPFLVKEYGGFDPELKLGVDWDLILRYTADHEPAFAKFIGAHYDNNPSSHRITTTESRSYANVIRNRYMVDWTAQEEGMASRDPELISIVMCVYGQGASTDACLRSIYSHEAGVAFELILVDNASDADTKQVLNRWASEQSNIMLITNPENYNFALGNNIGFTHTRGSRVVFLNNDTEVTPEWLRNLVHPLDDKNVLGSQPRLLYPDGTLQGIGVVFSEHSALGYRIYVNQPGHSGVARLPRNFQAVSAVCLAMRATDFAEARGFDPIYVNGQEDIDLCLRLGRGEASFRYVSDSIVFHHEGKTPGRVENIGANQEFFESRWKNSLVADDVDYYRLIRFRVGEHRPDNDESHEAGIAVSHPHSVSTSEADQSVVGHLQDHVVAIKIACPRPEPKDSWGDYHFAVSLAAALNRKGVKARIDFLETWETSEPADINLVLRGLSRFQPTPGAINLMWLISHPDMVAMDEMAEYDYVFVASDPRARELSGRVDAPVEVLLQCTDITRFHPDTFHEGKVSERLFVANSRMIERRVVREALDLDLEIDIYGKMWEGIAPASWIRGENIPNGELPRHYAGAGVVLNDHWDDMRERGFVSNRIFDALACGAPVVTDEVVGLPEELAQGCFFFGEGRSFREAVELASRSDRVVTAQAREIAEIILRQHSFDARAARILEVLDDLIAKRASLRGELRQRNVRHRLWSRQ